MATVSLLDWILSVLRDPEARASFQHDPDDYAERHGFGDLSSADVHDALWLIADNQSASYDGNSSSHVHYPPPHHYQNDDNAGHYLNNYITNNYTIVDDHDTHIDNSVHQRVDTDGGDFHQDIDNDTVVTSGDGASAVGGDNHGDISSAGHDNTTAFGDGDAVNTDFGGAGFDTADFGAGSSVNVGSGSSAGHASADTDVNLEDHSTRSFQDDDTVNVEHHEVGSHYDTHLDDHGAGHDDVDSHNDTHVDDLHLDAG